MAGNRSQFDVGILEHFLDAVGHSGPLLHQNSSIAVQVAQFTQMLARDKTPPQQTVLKQFRNSLAVFHVRLAAWYGLDVLRVDQHQVELAFEKTPDRFPVNAGGFHRQIRDSIRGKPPGQSRYVIGHSPEAAQITLLAAGSVD
ncbi:MAG TPA: hypothetical protein VNH18_07355 [Bryobacteraceae bacterium]|nr:hypothetical protein [Bryobacteraceae bacterium]